MKCHGNADFIIKFLYNEKTISIRVSSSLMTYTFKRKLMYANKSPRRIDRRSGARNKKIILKSYQKIKRGKKNKR
jgi:hypothetical protein